MGWPEEILQKIAEHIGALCESCQYNFEVDEEVLDDLKEIVEEYGGEWPNDRGRTQESH